MPGYMYDKSRDGYGFLRADGNGALVWIYQRKDTGEGIADWHTPSVLKEISTGGYLAFAIGNGSSPTTETGNNE